MRAPSPKLLVTGLILAAALSAFGGDVKIIANSSVHATSISTAELRSVYLLQKKTLKDGSVVEPVLAKRGPAHEAFLKQILNRDGEELRMYYQGLVFTGKSSMPKELSSEVEVVAYVARTRGAIGYVSESTPTPGVIVLPVVSDRTPKERVLLTRVDPEYPETLKQMGITGTVRLELTISPKGTVEGAVALGGNPILSEAALKAVRQWIYSPAPSRTSLEVTIPFGTTH